MESTGRVLGWIDDTKLLKTWFVYAVFSGCFIIVFSELWQVVVSNIGSIFSGFDQHLQFVGCC